MVDCDFQMRELRALSIRNDGHPVGLWESFGFARSSRKSVGNQTYPQQTPRGFKGCASGLKPTTQVKISETSQHHEKL